MIPPCVLSVSEFEIPRRCKEKSRFLISAKLLGKGSTGRVLSAVHEDSPGAECAVKIVPKQNNEEQDPLREIRTLTQLSHDNIIKIQHIEQDGRFFYLFMEHMDRGDLFSAVERAGRLPEAEARVYFKQMASALRHCHEKRICHHDFKLENCVLNSRGELRVIDFGYAIHVPLGSRISVYPGSPAYSAPEVLCCEPHGLEVDIFSLGVCLYFMVCGKFPFCDPDRTTLEELCVNVRRGRIVFPSFLSSEVAGLLRRMLCPASTRFGWDEIMAHPWLTKPLETTAAARRPRPSVELRCEDVHRAAVPCAPGCCPVLNDPSEAGNSIVVREPEPEKTSEPIQSL
eukprot:TRINITY_DN14164_c0_g1_i1.p1 TRINITY_DN14164_c0_g1~~TRINITY_DN14164_c0_g1_i1.p1  ORF type:complete len:373 (+),score=26.86 TRINITY_DN14164_c0_g1_i1:96-1121(+)